MSEQPPLTRRARALGAATLALATTGAVTALSAVPLVVGPAGGALLVVHVVAACAFFVILGVKLALLGRRARPGAARRAWKPLVAHGGTALGGYTLLTGILVLLDAAWSDQHLAASFWLSVVVLAHARHGARRARRLLSRAPSPNPAVAIRVSDRPQGDASGPAAPERRRQRVVVVGGGMAGHALAEALSSSPGRRITLLAEEDVEPYDRVRLTEVLESPGRAGLALRSPGWYRDRGIQLRLGTPAARLDPQARRVVDAAGEEHDYDTLLLATGSRAVVPPIPGTDRPQVFAYRNRRDAEGIAAAAADVRTAVVIGGGLLGLEAAAALCRRGLAVTVVEAADRLMAQQLDEGAAALLRRSLARLGVEVVTGARVAGIAPCAVRLQNAHELSARLVVIAAGIRPETTLARAAKLQVRRGIVIDDHMRTSADGVWAVGECAEHRGVVHGLWAPIAQQVRVASAAVDGETPPFSPSAPRAALKIAGIDLFSAGRPTAKEGEDEIVHSDGRRGSYAKLVLDGDRLVGGILLGDTTAAGELWQLLSTGAPVPSAGLPAAPRSPVGGVSSTPAAAEVICRCMGVSRGRIEQAIGEGRLDSVDGIRGATGAADGCGSCAGALGRILDEWTRRRGALLPDQASAAGGSAARSNRASA